MKRKASGKTKIKRSSGNIFADLGIENYEDEQIKADLLVAIIRTVRDNKLTQLDAATQMGVTQPKVSALLGGSAYGFSVEKLMMMLTGLGKSIDVTISTKRKNVRAAVHVCYAV
jgi:predicted XRE-type DNA-binding protein